MGCVWVFRTRVVMVGNSQSEFIVKVHTFIPKNSLEFLGIPKSISEGESHVCYDCANNTRTVPGL